MPYKLWAMALNVFGKMELYQMLNIFLGMENKSSTHGLHSLAKQKRMGFLQIFLKQLEVTPYSLKAFWLKMP